MRDYIEIGPVPYDEEATGPDHPSRMLQEARTFAAQIRRTFPQVDPELVTVKRFPHEFGSYCEVCIRFDPTDEHETETAFFIEDNVPARWDSIAKRDLDWTLVE